MQMIILAATEGTPLRIEADGGFVYLAIYSVYGGEYGNEQSFLEYYFLNESINKGDIIKVLYKPSNPWDTPPQLKYNQN